MEQFIFWGIAALVAISAMWTSYLGRRETERTIRKAIESGTVLDPAMIAKLKSGGGSMAPLIFVVAGIATVCAGFGFSVLALLMRAEAPDDFMAMLGVAALLVFTGAGLVAGGAWMRRQRKSSFEA